MNNNKPRTDKVRDFLGNIANKIEKLVKKVFKVKSLFILGLGGLLSGYILMYFRTYVIPYFTKLSILIETQQVEITITPFEVLLIILSVVFLIVGCAAIQRAGKRTIFRFLLLTVLFIFVGTMAMSQGKVNALFILTTIFLSCTLVELGINFVEGVYKWLKVKEEKKEQFNMAKLTLIWAVIAFLLGRILK